VTTSVSVARSTRVNMSGFSGTAVWLILALVLLVGLVYAPQIVAWEHAPTLLRQAAPLGMVAIGQTILIIGRGFDLSVGGLIGLINVVAAGSFARDWGLGGLLLAALATALIVGTINGALVVWGRVSPLIATLGMGFLLTGAMLVYSGGAPSQSVPDSLRAIAAGRFLGIYWGTWIWLTASIIGILVLLYTVVGRWVYAVGSNPETARLSGVPVAKVTLLSYVTSSLCAAVGGLLLAGFVGIGTLGAGQELLLNSIAAAIVGGTLLAGGRGGLGGTVGGVLLLTVLSALLTAFGFGKALNLVVLGFVLLGAASLYRRRQDRS
jgi:ribose transport system permease protein